MPDIEDVIAYAKALPDPRQYRPLYEYGEAIHIMRTEKDMTWGEIAREFENSFGIAHTTSHFSAAYMKYLSLNPVVKK